MRILELGSNIAPAYAGLLLAQQGHSVTKWVNPNKTDPILKHNRGKQLWEWATRGKTLIYQDIKTADEFTGHEIIIDNIRPTTWEKWGINRDSYAKEHHQIWVGIQTYDGKQGFDLIAQARAWGDKTHVPFYIGDTVAGLFAAFIALSLQSKHQYGLHPLIQENCLAKLVEGELLVPWDRTEPWNDDSTWMYDQVFGARIDYRGELLYEPPRDDYWRRENLPHDEHGSFII